MRAHPSLGTYDTAALLELDDDASVAPARGEKSSDSEREGRSGPGGGSPWFVERTDRRRRRGPRATSSWDSHSIAERERGGARTEAIVSRRLAAAWRTVAAALHTRILLLPALSRCPL